MFNISFDPIRIGNNKERILRTHLPINTPFKTATAAKRPIFLLFGTVCKHAITILTISENDLYVSLASIKSPTNLVPAIPAGWLLQVVLTYPH